MLCCTPYQIGRVGEIRIEHGETLILTDWDFSVFEMEISKPYFSGSREDEFWISTQGSGNASPQPWSFVAFMDCFRQPHLLVGVRTLNPVQWMWNIDSSNLIAALFKTLLRSNSCSCPPWKAILDLPTVWQISKLCTNDKYRIKTTKAMKKLLNALQARVDALCAEDEVPICLSRPQRWCKRIERIVESLLSCQVRPIRVEDLRRGERSEPLSRLLKRGLDAPVNEIKDSARFSLYFAEPSR